MIAMKEAGNGGSSVDFGVYTLQTGCYKNLCMSGVRSRRHGAHKRRKPDSLVHLERKALDTDTSLCYNLSLVGFYALVQNAATSVVDLIMMS